MNTKTKFASLALIIALTILLFGCNKVDVLEENPFYSKDVDITQYDIIDWDKIENDKNRLLNTMIDSEPELVDVDDIFNSRLSLIDTNIVDNYVAIGYVVKTNPTNFVEYTLGESPLPLQNFIHGGINGDLRGAKNTITNDRYFAYWITNAMYNGDEISATVYSKFPSRDTTYYYFLMEDSPDIVEIEGITLTQQLINTPDNEYGNFRVVGSQNVQAGDTDYDLHHLIDTQDRVYGSGGTRWKVSAFHIESGEVWSGITHSRTRFEGVSPELLTGEATLEGSDSTQVFTPVFDLNVYETDELRDIIILTDGLHSNALGSNQHDAIPGQSEGQTALLRTFMQGFDKTTGELVNMSKDEFLWIELEVNYGEGVVYEEFEF